MPLTPWVVDDEITEDRLNEMVDAFNSIEGILDGTFPDLFELSNGLSVTSSSSTVFAGTFQGTHATGGRGLLVKGQAGSQIFKVGEVGGIPFAALNLVDSTDPVNGTNLLVAAQADTDRVMADFGLTLTGTNNQDAGTARFTISTNSAGTKAIRALEWHTFQNTGAVGSVGASGQEGGVHNRAAVNTNNHGIYVQSNTFAWYQTVLRCEVTNGGSGYSNSFAVTFTGGGGTGAAGTATAVGGVIQSIAITNGGTGYTSRPTVVLTAGGGTSGAATAYAGYRNGTAFFAFGEDGWSNFGELWDRDGTSLWKVDSTGKTTGGTMVPRANTTYNLGDNTHFWQFAYVQTMLMAAGSASSPSLVSNGATQSGLWWNSTNPAMSVSGTQISEWSSDGLTLTAGSAILKQISTPSAPASTFTSVYSKTGGGLYSRANGGSEKQHKANGQYGFASGSTSNPTTTSASYADLANMSVTLTTTGGDLRCKFTGVFQHTDNTKAIVVAFSLDGAAEAFALSLNVMVANKTFCIPAMARFTGVAAGSHTVKIRWLTDGATATANGSDRYLEVQEEAV